MNRLKTTSISSVLPIVAAVILAALSAAPVFAAQPEECGKAAPASAAQVAIPADAAVNAVVPATPSTMIPTTELAAPTVATTGSADVDANPDGVELNYCPVNAAAGTLPDWMANPHRHGTCRCSCGYPCKTDADCGGASCDPFITCC